MEKDRIEDITNSGLQAGDHTKHEDITNPGLQAGDYAKHEDITNPGLQAGDYAKHEYITNPGLQARDHAKHEDITNPGLQAGDKPIKKTMEQQKDRSRRYLNPYLGGVLLGIVLIAANFIAGRGLGASGAVKSVVVAANKVIAPSHVEKNAFYAETVKQHPNPLKNWLVFEMAGVLVGGFLSGSLWGRIKLKVEHSPKITSRKRLVMAGTGGILFGFGSQLGRGCTSGSALSGMAVLSLGGFITMAAIFGTAFALAYFFRKNWI